jgi:hypothetical protein
MTRWEWIIVACIAFLFCFCLWMTVGEMRKEQAGQIVTDPAFHKRLKHHGLAGGSVVMEDWNGEHWFYRDGRKVRF